MSGLLVSYVKHQSWILEHNYNCVSIRIYVLKYRWITTKNSYSTQSIECSKIDWPDGINTKHLSEYTICKKLDIKFTFQQYKLFSIYIIFYSVFRFQIIPLQELHLMKLSSAVFFNSSDQVAESISQSFES